MIETQEQEIVASLPTIEFIGGPFCGEKVSDHGKDEIEIVNPYLSHTHTYTRCVNARNFFWHTGVK